MAQIRPDEVSSIIKGQLANVHTEAQLEEVGTVLQIGDGIARIYGLTSVKAGELIEFENGVNAIVLNLETRQCWSGTFRRLHRYQRRRHC